MDVSFTLPIWAVFPLAVYLCWVSFVMFIAAKMSRENHGGKLPPILWAFFSPWLLLLGVLDVGMQYTVAWLLLGKPQEKTLSMRMKRYRQNPELYNRWQLWVANNMCGKLLNPIDPKGHC